MPHLVIKLLQVKWLEPHFAGRGSGLLRIANNQKPTGGQKLKIVTTNKNRPTNGGVSGRVVTVTASKLSSKKGIMRREKGLKGGYYK